MMKALCFAHLRLRLQPAAGLHGPAELRPCGLPGRGGLRHRLAGAQRRLAARTGGAGGAFVGGALGLVVGAIAIRRQGIYFAMITLAMAQMVYFVCLQAPFTGGEDGLQGVPRGDLFGFISLKSDLTLYFVVLAVFVAVFLFIIRVVHSPFGQVLKAIRENEPRAISLGYDVDKYKLLAFVLRPRWPGWPGR
jgi:branched-chain amino acid transport system permease protein